MIIDQHISELLFQHDCVIIPEFGGFVANYASAKIHPTQHTFAPPSKNIVFNKNLKTNDGLLANKIVLLNTAISFSEANRLISRQVENWIKELSKGGKVKIKDVGTLYRDVEHNIQFEPDRSRNYLLDSFGLSTFQSPAIKRDNYQFKIEKEFKDRVEVLPAASRKINIKKYVRIALLAPVIIAAIWIPIKTDWLKDVNYSNLNPFAGKVKSAYSPRTTEVAINPPQSKVNDYSSVLDDTASTVKISFIDGGIESVIVKLREKKAEGLNPDVKSAQALTATAQSFHIIAGCFQNYDNAVRLVTDLQAQNISASIIGTNDAGLHMVSYGSFSTRNQALETLAQLRSTHNGNAWLLKK